jgi:ABC-type antimicrobial peptide transport system permease subunit
MDQIVEDSYGNQQFAAHLLEIFGGLALLLSITGLYALLSYVVAQRTREIGLRIALGAARTNVLWLVLRGAGVMMVAGVMAGSILALVVSRLMRSYLYGVSSHDALTLACSATLLFSAGILAAFLPAQRATRADPMEALRTE